MSTITSPLSDVTVGELVVERPGRARVFEKLGIDYCCGGKKKLTAVCADKALDVNAVLELVQKADAEDTAGDEFDPASATLTELTAHVEATHHAFLKRELPRVEFLAEKVARVHGGHTPSLVLLNNIFVQFADELRAHMMKEEQILFPMIRTLEKSTEPCHFHCGSLGNPISVMVREHEDAGSALEKMRDMTNGYTPPPDACNTYRAFFDALATIERDMHQHVHKENNILFPRAIALEAQHGSAGAD